MRSLSLVACGVIVVVFDLRFNGFDMVPEVLGWVLAVIALRGLVSRSGWFGGAAIAGVAGACLGIPAQFAEPGSTAGMVEGVVMTVLVFCTCTGIAAVVDEPQRRTARRIRLADVSMTALVPVLGVVPGSEHPAVVLPVVVAGIAVLIWFLIFLFSVSRHGGPGSPVGVPEPGGGPVVPTA